MREPTDLERRVTGAQAVLFDWIGQPFKWGERDCARLAHAALEARGRTSELAGAARYTSAAGSVRALRRLGYDDLPAALDGQGLQRIAPASALPLDIVALPSEGDMPSLTVALGGGRVLCFHPESASAVVFQPRQYVAAWRT